MCELRTSSGVGHDYAAEPLGMVGTPDGGWDTLGSQV